MSRGEWRDYLRGVALAAGHDKQAIDGYERVETVKRKDTSLSAKIRRAMPLVSDPGPVEDTVVVSESGMPLRDLELLAIGAQIQRYMILTNAGGGL